MNVGKCFSCFHCQYTAKRKCYLQRHIENWHGPNSKRSAQTEFLCVLCRMFSSPRREVVVSHYKEVHDVDVSPPVLYNFSDWDEFLAWKASIEKQEICEFIRCGSTNTKQSPTYYYRCHRDGYYKPRGNCVRRLKVKGSNKINGHCPASLSARKTVDGKVQVKFTSTHVGHKQELSRLRLPKEERLSLARKIASKVPLNYILDEIGTSSANAETQRIHLIKRQDLKNLMRDFKLGDDNVQSSNDRISVEAWITEMQEASNVVRLYKPQDSPSSRTGLRNDDFVLVIANDAQLEFLANWGKEFICVDGTDGKNAYGFTLTTMLTLDDLHEGVPCAFLISSRSDEEVIREFFMVLKESLGSEVRTDVFMSDKANRYYNAWKSVMPKPNKRLYSSWHVDRAWRKNLSKVKTIEKKTYVYWILRNMLQEPDEKAFARLLNNSLKELESDPDTADFAVYFHREYGSSFENWAYCFRKHARLNCNAHLHAMHKIVEHFYLNGNNVRRLDCALDGLMKYVRDKMFSRIIDFHRMKIPSKVRALRKRHERSLKLDMVVLKTGEGWDLTSKTPTRDLYSVKKTSKFGCCDCEMKCTDCSVCIHDFVCTCIDNTIKWNLCEHIHYVCRNYIESRPAVTVSAIYTDAPEIVGDDLLMDVTENELIYDEQQVVRRESSRPKPAEDNEKNKELVLSMIHDALSVCSGQSDFEIIINRLKPLKTLIEANQRRTLK